MKISCTHTSPPLFGQAKQHDKKSNSRETRTPNKWRTTTKTSLTHAKVIGHCHQTLTHQRHSLLTCVVGAVVTATAATACASDAAVTAIILCFFFVCFSNWLNSLHIAKLIRPSWRWYTMASFHSIHFFSSLFAWAHHVPSEHELEPRNTSYAWLWLNLLILLCVRICRNAR